MKEYISLTGDIGVRSKVDVVATVDNNDSIPKTADIGE